MKISTRYTIQSGWAACQAMFPPCMSHMTMFSSTAASTRQINKYRQRPPGWTDITQPPFLPCQ